ncbi:UNVERIFIED_CONTAM: Uncharacterized protein C05D11.1 [Trichonephila clavipes]
MSGTSIYECIAEILTDGDIKLSKYKSKKSGMTICIAEADGPLVGATEAHDDDGLPHTLEHLVFMGSEKYPYKSKRTPFVRPWQSPVPPLVESTTLEVNYPSDEDEHGLVIAAWRGPLANDYSQLISIQILMDYLTDTSVSPLNRELIETDDPLCNQVDYTVIENYESCIYVHLSNVPVKKLQEVKENGHYESKIRST